MATTPPSPSQKPATNPPLDATLVTEQNTIAFTTTGEPATNPTILSTAGPSPEQQQNQVWGDFQLGKLLGKGGMGAVYLGKQVSLDRPVAIKVLPAHLGGNEQFRKRFLLEAKAVAQMSSPHVVQVYAAGVHEENHWFAMEYVEGEDLSCRLRKGFKPSSTQALDLVTQAARGLGAAGELGIVHRDIKPANMMVTAKNQVKLMDFGLVRLARSEDTGLTRAGTIMGTVSYFSPEQGRGESCDQRTDIYALGIVFYELLTGTLPFTGEDATAIIYQHIHVAPKLPREINPDVSENYQAVVLKCLQKDPAFRYQNAQEMLGDLEDLRVGNSPRTALLDARRLRSGGTIVREQEFEHEVARRRALYGIIGAAAVVVFGGFWAIRYYMASPEPVVPPMTATTVAPAPSTADAHAASATRDASPALLTARAHLESARLTECRALVDTNRVLHPGDRDWEQLTHELGLAESAIAISKARTAYDQGDDAEVTRQLATARRYTPDDPVIADLSQRVTERQEHARNIVASSTAAVHADGASALTTAQAHLAVARLTECRALVDANRSINPNDPSWNRLAKDLERAETLAAVRDAQIAFDRGDDTETARLLASAQRLAPTSDDVKRLSERFATRQKLRADNARLINQALISARAGNFSDAEATLAAIKPEPGDSANVDAALRTVHQQRQAAEERARIIADALSNGDRALSEKEYERAERAYTTALTEDPKNAAAKSGIAHVALAQQRIAELRNNFDRALADHHLIEASTHLTALTELAPHLPSLAAAQQQLTAARQAEERARRLAEEREALFSGKAKQTAKILDDLSVNLPQCEAAFLDFVKTAGADRPERPLLELRLEDRRQRERVVTALTTLDRHITTKNAQGIRAHISDKNFAQALETLGRYAGLVFVSSLDQFERRDQSATATVHIRHALGVFPERILTYRYDLRNSPQGWIIAGAQLATNTP